LVADVARAMARSRAGCPDGPGTKTGSRPEAAKLTCVIALAFLGDIFVDKAERCLEILRIGNFC
jgi:hypothetical protein